MKRKTKTFSAKEAAKLTGYCHSMLCRICQNSGGKIGSAVHISEVGLTVWRLSSKDISALKHRKTLSLAEKRRTK
jgi:hypothetical protein